MKKGEKDVVLMRFNLLFLLIVLCGFGSNAKGVVSDRQRILLSGEWNVCELNGKRSVINLPGTTDEAKYGARNTETTKTTMLTRLYPFYGKMYYEKDIDVPASFAGKDIVLFMEKTKPSTLWIDGDSIGHFGHLHTPHIYHIKGLSAGKHHLKILIDNSDTSVPKGIQGSHAWTDNTQTNWNGILGDFYLEALPETYIKWVKVYPNVNDKNARVEVCVCSASDAKTKFIIGGKSWNSPIKKKLNSISKEVYLHSGENVINFVCPLGNNPLLWSEFSPALYRLDVSVNNKKGKDVYSVDFGMRDFRTVGTQFCINGTKTFLRGKHDGCVFPETGYAPMDVAEWQRVFKIAKSYGINHYRFHSWTPPMAAFKAADIEGIYLQVELPYWGKIDYNETELNGFLKNEGNLILETFGNSPSFTMLGLGNELYGEQDLMRSFVNDFRRKDNRHLYCFGSNNNLGTAGYQQGEDYFVTCRVGSDRDSTYQTHVRSSFSFADAYKGGILNGRKPSTNFDYSKAISPCPIPVVSHENCQFQIYPSYSEIKDFKGVLYPYNLEVFRSRLAENHLEGQAEAFHKASGKLSMICYKADLEICLRTPGFGGFQMLDLQDYPGQGSALVGILDSHMQSKGLIEPEQFRNFCDRVVPMVEFEKYCYNNGDKFNGMVVVANYSECDIANSNLVWSLSDSKGDVVANGEMKINAPQGNADKVGNIDFTFPAENGANEYKLCVKIGSYENYYDLWSYPVAAVKKNDCKVVYGSLTKELIETVSAGANVLFVPDHNEITDMSVGGLFTPDYWNYAMFKGISEWLKREVSPGTLSILTNPLHPVFNNFPTEMHSNWQWWSIVRNSRPFVLNDADSTYLPIVQVIDNVERNYKLGILFEYKLGKGNILISTCNHKAIMDLPEGKAYYESIINYMNSSDFNPKYSISVDNLIKLFHSKVKAKDIIEVKNITSYE